MHATDVIGYAADADVWCPPCAKLVYDRHDGAQLRCVDSALGWAPALDDEGNEVAAIFATPDAISAGDVCCRCSSELVEL